MAAFTVGATIGGGTPIAPDAVVDDGQAEVVVSSATGPTSRVGFAHDLRTGTTLSATTSLSRRHAACAFLAKHFP